MIRTNLRRLPMNDRNRRLVGGPVWTTRLAGTTAALLIAAFGSVAAFACDDSKSTSSSASNGSCTTTTRTTVSAGTGYGKGTGSFAYSTWNDDNDNAWAL